MNLFSGIGHGGDGWGRHCSDCDLWRRDDCIVASGIIRGVKLFGGISHGGDGWGRRRSDHIVASGGVC